MGRVRAPLLISAHLTPLRSVVAHRRLGNLTHHVSSLRLCCAVKKVRYEKLDAADPANREERNRLWEVSGIRGVFPQVFIVNEGGEASFVGKKADIEEMVETNESSGAFDDKFAAFRE